MPKRQSIEISSFGHANPIPGASKIGNLLMSSIINGANPGTKELPDDLARQISNIFIHIRNCVTAAGGTPDDIIKVNFWLKDPAGQRVALNEEWVKMFPDPASRPARHTAQLPADSRALVTCDFVAVIGS